MNTQQIIELIQQGLTISELVKKTNKSKSTIYLFAKTHSLKIKKAEKVVDRAIDKKEKICLDCKLEKPTTEFYKQVQKENERIWEYYDSICKPCRSIQSSQRRRNIKIQALEYLGWMCNRCKLVDKDYPQIYDFHHTDPLQKDFSISKTTKTFKSIKSELDKCIVLCANCHRKEHADE